MTHCCRACSSCDASGSNDISTRSMAGSANVTPAHGTRSQHVLCPPACNHEMLESGASQNSYHPLQRVTRPNHHTPHRYMRGHAIGAHARHMYHHVHHHHHAGDRGGATVPAPVATVTSAMIAAAADGRPGSSVPNPSSSNSETVVSRSSTSGAGEGHSQQQHRLSTPHHIHHHHHNPLAPPPPPPPSSVQVLPPAGPQQPIHPPVLRDMLIPESPSIHQYFRSMSSPWINRGFAQSPQQAAGLPSRGQVSCWIIPKFFIIST